MPKRIYVTDSPWNAVGDYVTDDTNAVNAAIASQAATGGDVIFPPGKYRGSFNRANMDGVVLIGEGEAIQSGMGVMLFPRSNEPGLDLSGSSGPIRGLQLGGIKPDGQWSQGQVGVLMGQTTQRPGRCTFCDFEDVFITGIWTGFGLAGIGITDWTSWRSRFWNYGWNNSAVYFGRSNRYGLTSPWSTLATQSYPSGNLLFHRNEAHDFKPNPPNRSNGMAFLFFGTDARIQGGSLIDSAANVGAIQCYREDNVPCTLTLDCAFAAHTQLKPNYCISTNDTGHMVYESKRTQYQFEIAKATSGITFV